MSGAPDDVLPRAGRLLCLALLLGAGTGLASGALVQAAPGGRAVAGAETQDVTVVMSAFVYNFAARHVKWPDSAHRDKTSAFVIGVLGKDAITPALVEVCRGRKSGERTIEVREIDSVAGARECHILFVPVAREADLPAIREASGAQPLLLVGASEDAVRKGAHIGFFLERSKIRFAADPESPRKLGLEISSELLKLARVVEKKSGGPR